MMTMSYRFPRLVSAKWIQSFILSLFNSVHSRCLVQEHLQLLFLGESTAITILRREHETICPVQLLLDYLAVRPICSGPLFLSASNNLITRWWLLKMLRSCLSYLGWDNLAVNTHSFRIGRATDMFAQNYSDSYIQHVGRWAFDAFKRYLRPQKVFA